MSAGEGNAALADHGLKALRKLFELLADVGGLGGFEQFFRAGVGRAEGEVFADGLAEQKGFLADHADVAAQRGEGVVADGAAVDEEGALGGFVEAGDQVDEG